MRWLARHQGRDEVRRDQPESPIGAAILGANEGDTVSYKAPNGREISVVIKEAKPLS